MRWCLRDMHGFVMVGITTMRNPTIMSWKVKLSGALWRGWWTSLSTCAPYHRPDEGSASVTARNQQLQADQPFCATLRHLPSLAGDVRRTEGVGIQPILSDSGSRPTTTSVESTDGTLCVLNYGKVARKPCQHVRPRASRTRTKPK